MSLSSGGTTRPSRRWRTAILWIVGGLFATIVGTSYAGFLNHDKADETLARMRALENLLIIEQVQYVDEASLRAVAERNGSATLLLDAWGHRLVVETVDHGDAPGFRITSLGRDGTKGTCCERFVSRDWDADAVRQREEWLQAW
jgi:hypothetical protein